MLHDDPARGHIEAAPPVPLLAAEDLAVDRGGRRLVSGVGLSVRAGDLLLVLGPNGVGKSSLLRVLAGMAPPGTGRLLWSGVPIRPRALARRARYLGHGNAVKPSLTPAEDLGFWTRLHGGAPASAPGFGTPAFDDTPGRHLSAGQQRRLALARLAAAPAALWLLDEPEAGLDAEALALLQDAVAAQCRSGAVILATHRPELWPAGRAMTVAPAPLPEIEDDPWLAPSWP